MKNITEQETITTLRESSNNVKPDEAFRQKLAKEISTKLRTDSSNKRHYIFTFLKQPKWKVITSLVVLLTIVPVLVYAFYPRSVTTYVENNNAHKLITDEPGNKFPGSNFDKSRSNGLFEASDANLGLAVGGANDINNFRENIKNNYLPLPSDITYEGLYYDYYFNTGKQQECSELFCPSYSLASTKDPFNGQTEYFMSVGLNSNIKAEDFQRKKQRLVIVLDISGSMDSAFNTYYYDKEPENPETTPKIEVAKESILSLLTHLNEDDYVGLVVFDESAEVIQDISKYDGDHKNAMIDTVKEIKTDGGTNIEAGMRTSSELFNALKGEGDNNEYDNRIIFITDAMPNTGNLSDSELAQLVQNNANNSKVNTTFIGVGVDFNSELVELITKTRGANYYAVHSSKDFKQRMDEEFEFMVTPLVYDLNLKFESSDFEIEKVYGSPEADQATGELMKVNTLFPSSSKGGETKGGIVVLKLKKKGEGDRVRLAASYKNRDMQEFSNSQEVTIQTHENDQFDHSGIRKAILLSRYANLMKNWLINERSRQDESLKDFPKNSRETILMPPTNPDYSKWERKSIELQVSDEYREKIKKFITYYQGEMNEIGDDDLKKEVELMEKVVEKK